ncbi:hypothetical protein WHR41_06072 [Cladosporium halotolerans]|uniref:Uncharacterized protein n=1 Tax=Cladosporium halotolerans TaxID=1052096 RepID=A0AB34KLQ4_9PEZI
MPRSPSDATRFTSNGPPNAAPSVNSAGSRINFGEAPPNETAQQKIARLRAAAANSKRGKETGFDTVVRVGRVWADRAHKATAFGLIGLTIVAGVVATAGITDMLMHNRRRRNEWLAEKRAQSAAELLEARRAQSVGTVTEDQMLLINRERVREEAEAEKKNQPGMFKRAGSYLFGGLEKEEQKGGKLGAAAAKAGEAVQPVKEQLLGQNEDPGVLKSVEQKIESNRRQGEHIEEMIKPLGGPLDRQAESAVQAATSSGKSWTSWLTGR